jgi:hypothetical protein
MKGFFFAIASRLSPGSTDPHVLWVWGSYFFGVNICGMKLTTRLHLMTGLRMRGAIPLLPQYVFMALCLVKHRDNFTFTFYTKIYRANLNFGLYWCSVVPILNETEMKFKFLNGLSWKYLVYYRTSNIALIRRRVYLESFLMRWIF